MYWRMAGKIVSLLWQRSLDYDNAGQLLSDGRCACQAVVGSKKLRYLSRL